MHTSNYNNPLLTILGMLITSSFYGTNEEYIQFFQLFLREKAK